MTEDFDHSERHLHASDINASLAQILSSTRFKGSVQLQSLLKYIVEEGLRGHDDALKERIIGIEVFGKKPDYDTADDPIVRSRVGQLRKRLGQYYESEESRGASVQIVIPNGSYRPSFSSRPVASNWSQDSPVRDTLQTEAFQGIEEDSEPETVPDVPMRSRAAQWRVRGGALLAACAVLSVAWILIAYWTTSELNLFWKPFFENKKPVVIYVGTAQLYVPTASSAERALSLAPPANQKQPITEWRVPALAQGQVLSANDIQTNQRDFVAVGDIGAVVDTVELLAAHRRSIDLRSGPNMPFLDIRTSPLILTGAGSNYWALDITRDLPFYLDSSLRIRERGGQGQVWSTSLWSDHTITEDYAIVSRLLNSKTGAPIIILAGITMCGTRAAGEFVTDPAQLTKLRIIPRDALEHKNLEFVLHANLVDCEPTSMDIVSMRYW